MAYLLVLFSIGSTHAASVPVTIVDDLDGTVTFPFNDERLTCDPDFWDVLADRAWEEGQREITQNNNLIARPDSVLSISCFDSFLDHASQYADINFPTNPDESEGGRNGIFTDTLIVLPDRTIYDSVGAIETNGFLLFATLELLVLDQLIDATTALAAAQDAPLIAPCTAKDHYISENFPALLIGGRAIDVPPAQTEVPVGFEDDRIQLATHSGCERMNEVWNATRCYNFATESVLYSGENPPGGDHDGFYSFEIYTTLPDPRTKDNACASPRADGSPDFPTAAGLACDGTVHSNDVTLAELQANFTDNEVPTWQSAFEFANPPAGEPGGAAIEELFLDFRDTAICGELVPIKTGFIVSTGDGSGQYVDAVCPAPGCFFIPPNSLAGNGTCN